MHDMEKVIERLKYCAETRDGYVRDCINDALAMLKEQEPVEPTVSSLEEYDGHVSWWYQCGKCKRPIDYGDRFCRSCGQEVKWE